MTLKFLRGRLPFVLIVIALLSIIGRNLYRHYRDSALIYAVETKDDAAVRDLLAQGADPNSAQVSPEGYRKTALIYAVDAHDAAAVRCLLDGGADANSERTIPGRQDKTSAFKLAMENLYANKDANETGEVACLLISHGANIRGVPPAYSTYLQTACESGHVNVARCLLEHGTDPNLASPLYVPPLDAAIDYGLQAGHSFNGVPIPISAGEKPQRLRVSREMVLLLRQHGVRLTPLQAVKMEDAALLRETLAMGANVNQEDAMGRTALQAAAQQGSLPMINLLLAQGANVNQAGKYYASPLMAAVGSKRFDLVRLLLAQGANANIRPASGHTALYLARHMGNGDIIKALEQIHAKDE